MAHVLAQARWQRDSALPEDVVVNTFHFDTGAPAPVSVAQATAIAERVRDFYLVQPPAVTGTVGGILSAVLALTGHEVRIYDMADIKPRPPIFTLSFSRPSESTGDALPSEVALCLSFSATRGPGDNPARFRGRLYIGPFMEVSSGAVVAADARPTSQVINLIAAAGKKLMDDGLTTGAAVWSVYSPTDAALRPATRCHVDDAWDTQRRRGAAATSRVTLDRAAV